jgi:hypothetical protein
LNINCPLDIAISVRSPDPALAAAAALEAELVAVLEDVVAADDAPVPLPAALDELPLEPPQAATPSASATALNNRAGWFAMDLL